MAAQRRSQIKLDDANTEVLVKGWLAKRGHMVKNWKDRYCVLKVGKAELIRKGCTGWFSASAAVFDIQSKNNEKCSENSTITLHSVTLGLARALNPRSSGCRIVVHVNWYSCSVEIGE